MIESILERFFYFFSLGVFGYAVFLKNFSPWFFLLMIVLDFLFTTYMRAARKQDADIYRAGNLALK